MSYHNGPRIVTNGLVLYLDAGNSKSYPGSGTTWTDLSGNNNNGTLANGPTFSSLNRGSIIFDGTNDSCSYSLALNKALTVITWAKSPTSTWNDTAGLGSCRFQNGFIIHNNESTKVVDAYIMNGNISASFSYLGSVSIPDIAIPTMYSFVTNGINNHQFYVNNSVVINSAATISRSDTPSSVTISLASDLGGRWNNIILYSHLLYNRALSPTEILQNYNATKGRFNL
jgi:hypothetical protein